MATSSTGKMKLKLVVDTGAERVVFAETGKDFVDFLFTLPLLQLAPLVRALSRDGMEGCLGELYGGLEGFSAAHMMPNVDRGSILKPAPPASPAVHKALLMLRYDGLPAGAGGGGTGYVKGGECVYMVTDDLVARPFGTSGVVGALKAVKDGRLLQEQSVEFGTEEALNLIRSSLSSKTVLSDIFLGKKLRSIEEECKFPSTSPKIKPYVGF